MCRLQGPHSFPLNLREEGCQTQSLEGPSGTHLAQPPHRTQESGPAASALQPAAHRGLASGRAGMALGLGTRMIHELARWTGTDLAGKSPKMILLSSLALFVWNLLEKSRSGAELPPGSDSQLPASWRSDPLKYYFSTPRASHVPGGMSPTQINTWGRSRNTTPPAAVAPAGPLPALTGAANRSSLQSRRFPPAPKPAQTITFTCSYDHQ